MALFCDGKYRITVQVRQLVPNGIPRGIVAAAARDLPATVIDVGERAHVDLVLSRSVRLVGEPAAVG